MRKNLHEAVKQDKLGLSCADHLEAWRELLTARMHDIRNEYDGQPSSGSDSEPPTAPQPKKRSGTLKLANATATQQHRVGKGLSGAAPAVHGELDVELGINLQTRDAEPHIATGDNGQSGKWNIGPFGVHPVSTLIVNLSSRTDPDVTGYIES